MRKQRAVKLPASALITMGDSLTSTEAMSEALWFIEYPLLERAVLQAVLYALRTAAKLPFPAGVMTSRPRWGQPALAVERVTCRHVSGHG